MKTSTVLNSFRAVDRTPMLGRAWTRCWRMLSTARKVVYLACDHDLSRDAG